MVDGTVRELDSEDEWRETFPVVRQLRPHLDEEEFVSRVGRLQVDGYRLFGLFENGADETDEADGAKGADENNDRRGEPTPRAVAGVAVEYNLYDGRHVWIFDLVTDEAHRSSGFGEQLCSWIEEWAADRGCEAVVLSSGLERTDAHRFYEEQRGMKRASYVFKKPI